jgi:hypothetical protein
MTADSDEHTFHQNSKFNLPRDYCRLQDSGPCICYVRIQFTNAIVSGTERTLRWAEGRLGSWAQLCFHSASLHLRNAFTSFVSPCYSLHWKCKHKTWQPSWNRRHHLNSGASSHQRLLCQTLYYVFILILLLAARPPSQFHALLSRKVRLAPLWKFTVHGTSSHRQSHFISTVLVSESSQRNSRHFTQWPQEDIFWCVLLVTITVDISVHHWRRIDSRYRLQKDKYPRYITNVTRGP